MFVLYSGFMSKKVELAEKTTDKNLSCPLCRCQDFKKDKVVLPKYGMFRISDFKTKVLICNDCGYILLFEEGNTFFLGVD